MDASKSAVLQRSPSPILETQKSCPVGVTIKRPYYSGPLSTEGEWITDEDHHCAARSDDPMRGG